MYIIGKLFDRYYLFFTNSFVYYGLTLNSGSLIPGNLHFNIIVRFNLACILFVHYFESRNLKPKPDFQRIAWDRRQHHHHLCPSLPGTQALCMWQYGNRFGQSFRFWAATVSSPISLSGGVTLFAVPYVDAVAGKAALAQIGRFAITGSFSMVIKWNSN